MPKTREEQIDEGLDSFLTTALSIHDVMKAVPHPYNAVGDMTNKWAHDFVGFAFMVKAQSEEVIRLRAHLNSIIERAGETGYING